MRSAATSAVLCWLAATLPAQTTTNVAVDTVVTDAAGRPLAGAEFADRWQFAAGRWCGELSCSPPDQKAPLRSDAEGRLRGTWVMDPFDTPLLGRSPEGALVAVVRPEWTAGHESVVRQPVVLRPAVVLRGVVRAPGPVSVFVQQVATQVERLGFGWGFRSDTPQVRLPLPPGTYQVTVGAGHSRATTRTIVLSGDRGEVDAGSFTILWQPFDLVGEVLPDWELASVDNLPTERSTLAALRGKPLLIVFDAWGRRFVSVPVPRQGVAALAHHARRAGFEVVLFDTSTGPPSPGELPEEPVVERTLPVLHPVAGKNADTLYGANYAIVVLDRDGRLVHCGRDLPAAVAALERLLPAAPEPR